MKRLQAFLFLCSLLFFSLPSLVFGNETKVCNYKALFPNFPRPHLLSAMRAGFNLPNWDAALSAKRPKIKTLKALKKEGFHHIRLPFFHEKFEQAPLREMTFLPYLENVIKETEKLVALGFSVSLDLHPSSSFNALYKGNTERYYEHFAGLWLILARHFKSLDPNWVAIELLNEPVVGAEIWQNHQGDLVKRMREVLPNHTLVVSPGGSQRHEALSHMVLLDDDNVIYAVHFYDPFFFTHQGADWLSDHAPERMLKNIPFPARFDDFTVKRIYENLLMKEKDKTAAFLKEQLFQPWGYQDLEDAFNLMFQWSRRYQQPVIINEFGVLSYHAPRLSRLSWLRAFAKGASKRCLLWAHWDFSDGFGFVDPVTGNYDKAIVNLLLEKGD